MYIPFNNSVDKITERELVPDILHRVKFSNTIHDKDTTYFKEGSSIEDIIIRIIDSLPDKVRENYNKIHIGTIYMRAGTSSGACSIELPPDEFQPQCVYAVSQQTGIDYSGIIEKSTLNGITTFMLNVADNFLNDDYIRIYVY